MREEETVRCPISGISCDECGYTRARLPNAVNVYGECFLVDLIATLDRIADELKGLEERITEKWTHL